jgi:hypothetical protein
VTGVGITPSVVVHPEKETETSMVLEAPFPRLDGKQRQTRKDESCQEISYRIAVGNVIDREEWRMYTSLSLMESYVNEEIR